MALPIEDIICLRNGQAPAHLGLIHDMTLGSEIWLDRFERYYLDQFIPTGGSKVKVLVGNEGSGKSHLLRCIQLLAEQKNYTALYFSARQVGAKLCDVPNLYRMVAAAMDLDRLITGLAGKVGSELGYAHAIYDGKGRLLPYITEEGYGAPDAAREIRVTIARLLRHADISPSFFTFAFSVLKERLIGQDIDTQHIAARWLLGEKLSPSERRESGLYETLSKATARRWLDSLLKLMTLSGQPGLVVLIDDLDVLYERSPETGRFMYTPSNNKDTYELFRQIIDDADLLKNLALVLAGRRNLLEDEKRGFKSYEALWMRLQTGLVPSGHFNALCDIVDVDQHLASLGPDFPEKLARHLTGVFANYGMKRKYRDLSMDMNLGIALKTVVIDQVFTSDSNEETVS